MASLPIVVGLSAAGTTQGTSLALDPSKAYYQITVCAAGAGVQLPVGFAGSEVFIQNSAAAACLIYPRTLGSINSLAVNLPFSLAAGGVARFTSLDGLVWGSAGGSGLTLAPSSSVAASTTLLPSASGSSIFLPSAAAAVAIALPTALSAGMTLDFYVTGTLANAVTLNAGSAIVKGNHVASSAVATTTLNGTARTNVILGGTSVVGDHVRFVSDGAQWVAAANTSIATSITVS